jgi:hypothetical protein
MIDCFFKVITGPGWSQTIVGGPLCSSGQIETKIMGVRFNSSFSQAVLKGIILNNVSFLLLNKRF